MENRLNQVVQLSSLLEKSGNLKELNALDAYNEIEVTEQELQAAITAIKKARSRVIDKTVVIGVVDDAEIAEIKLKIRMHKHGEIARKKYSDRLKKVDTYPQLTGWQLYRNLLKKGYKIDKDNKIIVKNLCKYFAGEKSSEYSLNKGIFLFGGVGVGKTSLMAYFRRNSHNPYILKSCREITYDYQNNGADAVIKYGQLIKTGDPGFYFGHKNLGLCFDDLGTEEDKNNFGNKLNVIADVFQNRYDRLYDFEGNPLLMSKTHCTSNLSESEVIHRYGSRFRSRIDEMFNVFEFPETAPDRRKFI